MLYSKMSIEHLLPNNTSGTAGHYEETSGDSPHSLVLLNKQPLKVPLGNIRATYQATNGQGRTQ